MNSTEKVKTPYLDEYLKNIHLSKTFRVGSTWIAHDSPFGSGAIFKIVQVINENEIVYVYWDRYSQTYPIEPYTWSNHYTWSKSVKELEEYLNNGIIERFHAT